MTKHTEDLEAQNQPLLSAKQQAKVTHCLEDINRVIELLKKLDEQGDADSVKSKRHKKAIKRQISRKLAAIEKVNDEIFSEVIAKIDTNYFAIDDRETTFPIDEKNKLIETIKSYQTEFKKLDLTTGETFAERFKIRTCQALLYTYTAAGFITGGNSCLRAAKHFDQAAATAFYLLAAPAAACNAKAQNIFAERIFEEVDKLPKIFKLFILASAITSATPASPVLNAEEYISMWLLLPLSIGTFCATLPIFAKDFKDFFELIKSMAVNSAEELKRIWQAGIYNSVADLSQHLRNCSFYSMASTAINLTGRAAGVATRAAAYYLGYKQSDGYVKIFTQALEKYCFGSGNPEATEFIRWLSLAARIPFVTMATEKFMEAVETYMNKGKEGLPSDFLTKFAQIFVNSLIQAIIITANAKQWNWETFYATVIFSTIGRSKGLLDDTQNIDVQDLITGEDQIKRFEEARLELDPSRLERLRHFVLESLGYGKKPETYLDRDEPETAAGRLPVSNSMDPLLTNVETLTPEQQDRHPSQVPTTANLNHRSESITPLSFKLQQDPPADFPPSSESEDNSPKTPKSYLNKDGKKTSSSDGEEEDLFSHKLPSKIPATSPDFTRRSISRHHKHRRSFSSDTKSPLTPSTSILPKAADLPPDFKAQQRPS